MNQAYCHRFHRSQFEIADDCRLPAFGHPVSNNGWVKCTSKSFPGKSYYFNVDSRCTTWGRPVSSFVATPIVRPLNLRRDEDFLDEAPIEVSDIEDDDDDDFDAEKLGENVDMKQPIISEREAKRRKIFAEVLFKLYHCYGDDWNGNEIDGFIPTTDASLLLCKCETIEDGEEDESTNSPELILPEICYSSSSDDESLDEMPENNNDRGRLDSVGSASTIIKQRKSSDTDGDNSECLDENMDLDRFSRLDLLENGDPDDRRVVEFGEGSKSSFLKSEDSDVGSQVIGASSEDDYEDADEEDEEEEDKEMEEGDADEKQEIGDPLEDNKTQFSLPKLKTIEFSDLMTAPRRVYVPKNKKVPAKRKAPRPVASEENSEDKGPPRKIKKIIYELNGVKTINYDFITPELPPGVRASNLSDSGSSSVENAYSLWDRDKLIKSSPNQTEKTPPKCFNLGNDFTNIPAPCLSDSSTSESSSSSSSDSTVTKFSTGSESRESDSSESSESSGGSGTSRFYTIKTLVKTSDDLIKKENLDCSETSTQTRRRKLIMKFSRAQSNYEKEMKFESGESSTSLSNPDTSWRRSDLSQTDEDD